MAVTISIALQKGGVGKSTTAQALASTLGFKGYKVLLIDFDSQANVTYSSDVTDPEWTITSVLSGRCKIEDALLKCKYYDLLAADIYLVNVESTDGVEPTMLRNTIAPIQDNYDFIVIDTPPSLGNLSYNALTASDYIIIPIEPRPYALQGLDSFNDTIIAIREQHNPNLEVLGILLVKYSNRTVLNRNIATMINNYAHEMDTRIFNTTIRDSVVVGEAQIMRQPLIDYAKNSKPNIDYKGFTTEILQLLGRVDANERLHD